MPSLVVFIRPASLSSCDDRRARQSIGAGGRHYEGDAVEGFGNELFITSGGEQLKKSISRSTVNLALKKTREKEITGPKSLGVPGAGSYLFAMFKRFGLIT